MKHPISDDTALLEAAGPVNILIVDDEPKNLTVLESVLNDPDYRLVRALSGDEALLALMAQEFAVLVLDVRMPGMTGFELAQLVKERKRTARIPIIFLTAYYNEDQHILEGYGTGAVDYLHKPVNPSVLRSKVAVFAELHKKRRALEAANRALKDLNESLDRRVTERTTALLESEARLLEANRRKDEFLATLAHELRNPLAPVRNAAQVLRLKGVDGELKWASGLIDRQVSAMSRLIDDLMDVSRINQGKIELRRALVDLQEVLADAIETTRPLIEESQHRLTIDLPAGGLKVHADRTRLSQAFMNLLNNAAKYTDRGGEIALSARVDSGKVVVTVKDSGIGIPGDHLESVFEMFSQVETALTRSRGGLGIGLSLTQQLVQMHGGSVSAHSAGVGKGSEFRVQLPLAADQANPVEAPAEAAAATAAAELRILVADDNQDAADTLSVLLEMMGHAVRHVNDGEAAVKAAQEFDPHLVLLDIGMPKLNGYEACKRIRVLPGGTARTLVAVTGWGQPEDRRSSNEAGFDHHLVKPLDLQALSGLVSKLAARDLQ
ncbi:MAG TPA: response regulator [Ramlibacter sp.]|nr:response regulator [Ramlibacter sp.]